MDEWHGSAIRDANTLVTALGMRDKVQQWQHGEYRHECKGDSHRIGLYEPNVQKHLGDQRNGAQNEGEEPYDL